ADHFEGDDFVANGNRVEIVLACERIPHIRTSQRNCADSPARILCEQAFDEPGLMGAMKRTGSEVHDAGGQGAAIILGRRDGAGEVPQRMLVQPIRHSVTPLFQIEISRSPFTSLRAGVPDAVASTSRISSSPASCIGLPASTVPASKSIQWLF